MKNWAKKILANIFISQARKILLKYDVKVIVVAGSVGKTNTNSAITEILSSKYRVQHQRGNVYNIPLVAPFVITGQQLPKLTSLFGWYKCWRVGQNILKKGYDYDVVVLEYGIDRVGEMLEFAPLCSPDIAVVTAVAPEHMEFFGDIETVAREELSISKYAKNILINQDSVDKKYVNKYAEPDATIKYIGIGKGDYCINADRDKTGKYIMELTDNQGKTLCQSATNMIGIHNIYALAFASIIGHKMGLHRSEIERMIAQYTNFRGRMRVFDGKNGSTVIDDTYNSSPVAAIAGLKTLYDISATNKIALLGNMNELGEYSKKAHEEVGQYCDPKKLDLVITLGADANKYTAGQAEQNGCRVYRAKSPVEAGEYILKNLNQKTVVLAKGSQNGVYAEEAVKLMLRYPKDTQNLVRQSPTWLAKKQKQFPEIS